MQCDIHCRLYTAAGEIEQGRLQRAAALLPEIEDLLHRGIECGALVDPWNILGFGAQYSLFPAVENSVHDHRVDELVDVMAEIFDLYVQLEREAAAAGDDRLQDDMAEGLDRLAQWWDKYASTEVLSVEGLSGQETSESARHVAAALRAWHEAGTAAGDIAFWQVHGERFRSTKTYALVVESLLDQGDPVAAMALLVQWINQSDEIPLIDESYAFDDLALRWMEDLWAPDAPKDDARGRRAEGSTRRRMSRRQAALRRRIDGRWPASSSTTWRPMPESIGKSPTSSWATTPRPATNSARRKTSTICSAPPTRA